MTHKMFVWAAIIILGLGVYQIHKTVGTINHNINLLMKRGDMQQEQIEKLPGIGFIRGR